MPRAVKMAAVVVIALVAAAVLIGGAVYLLIDADDVVAYAKSRVKAESGRTLAVNGPASLKKGWRPRLVVSDVSLSDAEWSNRAAMMTADRIDVQVRLWSLLFGPIRVDNASIRDAVVHLEKSRAGEGNWKFGDAGDQNPLDADNFPEFHRLRARDIKVLYRGQTGERRVELEIDRLDSLPRADGSVDTAAAGTLQGDEYKLTLHTAPWKELRRKDNPYAVEIDFGIADFRLRAKGAASEPLRLRSFDVAATVEGQNLANLYLYTGLVLPQTPPYALKGRLLRAGENWSFEKFDGMLGESPLAGTVYFARPGGRATFTGAVHSKALRLVDIAGLFGLDPARFDPRVETSAKSADDAENAPMAKPIFSDSPIELGKLKAMDAEIRLTADTSVTRSSVFDEIDADIKLNEGVLTFSPFAFESGGGAIRVDLRLDAASAPPALALAADIADLPASRIVGDRELDKVAGPVSGQLDVKARGDSIGALAGDLGGEASLVMDGGKISHLIVELIGLDVAETLGVLVSDDEMIAVRCGVAEFSAKNGVLTADKVYVDTEDTIFIAEGKIDLGEEAADLRIDPEPKDWSPLSLEATIAVEGPLTDLDIFPDPLGIGSDGVLKKAANAVATTVSGLLPPVEAREGENADCLLPPAAGSKSG